MTSRIRITGFGGQGVITAGYILGRAAALYDDLHATLTQSYGPEARGSACSAQVTISDKPILNPFFKTHDVLAAMSQEGFDKHIITTKEKGLVLIDEDLVELQDPELKQEISAIRSTRLAEDNFGNRIVTNIVMLGFLTGKSGVVSEKAIEEAVRSVVPAKMVELNVNALKCGLEFKTAGTEEEVTA